MILSWYHEAWDDYVQWQADDKWKILLIGPLLRPYWDAGFLRLWDSLLRCRCRNNYGAVPAAIG